MSLDWRGVQGVNGCLAGSVPKLWASKAYFPNLSPDCCRSFIEAESRASLPRCCSSLAEWTFAAEILGGE